MDKFKEFCEWAGRYHGWFYEDGKFWKTTVQFNGVHETHRISNKKAERYYAIWNAGMDTE
jgi:hypothetical protein